VTTIILNLDSSSEDYKILHNLVCRVFLEGECYAFAIALNRGLGWPMVGLMKENVIWHAGVRVPDGRIRDARGILTEYKFGIHFMPQPFNIREITTDELYATRPVEESFIKDARQFAEVLWPDLPWVESHTTKLKEFADELEALSRKHGLWICGGVPGNPPRLFTEKGGEGGYVVGLTMDGQARTVDRYLVD
jgi:hypothetical protein